VSITLARGLDKPAHPVNKLESIKRGIRLKYLLNVLMNVSCICY